MVAGTVAGTVVVVDVEGDTVASVVVVVGSDVVVVLSVVVVVVVVVLSVVVVVVVVEVVVVVPPASSFVPFGRLRCWFCCAVAACCATSRAWNAWYARGPATPPVTALEIATANTSFGVAAFATTVRM